MACCPVDNTVAVRSVKKVPRKFSGLSVLTTLRLRKNEEKRCRCHRVSRVKRAAIATALLFARMQRRAEYKALRRVEFKKKKVDIKKKKVEVKKSKESLIAADKCSVGKRVLKNEKKTQTQKNIARKGAILKKTKWAEDSYKLHARNEAALREVAEDVLSLSTASSSSSSTISLRRALYCNSSFSTSRCTTKTTASTPDPFGSPTIYKGAGGRLRGGDSKFAYTGYSRQQWTPGPPSVALVPGTTEYDYAFEQALQIVQSEAEDFMTSAEICKEAHELLQGDQSRMVPKSKTALVLWKDSKVPTPGPSEEPEQEMDTSPGPGEEPDHNMEVDEIKNEQPEPEREMDTSPGLGDEPEPEPEEMDTSPGPGEEPEHNMEVDAVPPAQQQGATVMDQVPSRPPTKHVFGSTTQWPHRAPAVAVNEPDVNMPDVVAPRSNIDTSIPGLGMLDERPAPVVNGANTFSVSALPNAARGCQRPANAVAPPAQTWPPVINGGNMIDAPALRNAAHGVQRSTNFAAPMTQVISPVVGMPPSNNNTFTMTSLPNAARGCQRPAAASTTQAADNGNFGSNTNTGAQHTPSAADIDMLIDEGALTAAMASPAFGFGNTSSAHATDFNRVVDSGMDAGRAQRAADARAEASSNTVLPGTGIRSTPLNRGVVNRRPAAQGAMRRNWLARKENTTTAKTSAAAVAPLAVTKTATASSEVDQTAMALAFAGVNTISMPLARSARGCQPKKKVDNTLAPPPGARRAAPMNIIIGETSSQTVGGVTPNHLSQHHHNSESSAIAVGNTDCDMSNVINTPAPVRDMAIDTEEFSSPIDTPCPPSRLANPQVAAVRMAYANRNSNSEVDWKPRTWERDAVASSDARTWKKQTAPPQIQIQQEEVSAPGDGEHDKHLQRLGKIIEGDDCYTPASKDVKNILREVITCGMGRDSFELQQGVKHVSSIPKLAEAPQGSSLDQYKPVEHITVPEEKQLAFEDDLMDLSHHHPAVWEALIGIVIQSNCSMRTLLVDRSIETDDLGNKYVEEDPEIYDTVLGKNVRWDVDWRRVDDLSVKHKYGASIFVQEYYQRTALTGTHRKDLVAILNLIEKEGYFETFAHQVMAWTMERGKEFVKIARKAGMCEEKKLAVMDDVVEWLLDISINEHPEFAEKILVCLAFRYPHWFDHYGDSE